jgi:hypothetical protein
MQRRFLPPFLLLAALIAWAGAALALALAQRLRPEGRRIAAISGSGDFDGLMERVARAQLAAFAVEYCSGRRIEEVLAGVAAPLFGPQRRAEDEP